MKLALKFLPIIKAISFQLRNIRTLGAMACSRYEYVKNYEVKDVLLPNVWIIIRVDGKGFHKFSKEHDFEKPNDERALNLMTNAAQTVMEKFNDIILSYGQSDEYSFVFSPQDELCPPPTEDDELTLPRASINKIIKELVPSVRVANESRELLLNCCSEFIHLISSEANEVCNMRNKKTINAEHVLEALDRLGFRDYKQEAEAVLNDCKEVAAKRRRQSTRLENLGIPEEELLRQQQELFAKAREEQAREEQQQWMNIQASAVQQNAELLQKQMKQAVEDDDDDDDDY